MNFYRNETYKVIFPFKSQEYNIMRNKISSELYNGNFITTQSILVKTNVIRKTRFLYYLFISFLYHQISSDNIEIAYTVNNINIFELDSFNIF